MKRLTNEEVWRIGEIGRDFSDATIFMHEAIANKARLSGADHKYLGLLIKHGAMTAGELAKKTGLTTGAVTGLVDRLEKKELVHRKPHETDRRTVMIVPDRVKADQLLSPLFSGLQSKIQGLIAGQTEEELAAVTKYMLAAIDIMKEVTGELKSQK